MFCKVLWNDITEKRLLVTAGSLTYSTLLAVVPIMAVVFGIARGFGYSIFIEDWFRTQLESQPEVADTLVALVNSYLKHTQKGLFLGIGLLFMLWTVLMLISNIEDAFNDVWQVKRQRSLFRTFTDYMAMLLIIPIFIVVTSGLSIWIAAINHQLENVMVIGPVMTLSIKLSPFLLWSIAFTLMYMFVPNTKVSLRSAIVPGILAGCSMQIFQAVYINSQIWISNYNAIYGSFAIIPFSLLWMQINWIICLVGAEISYCRQNSEDVFHSIPAEPSYNSRYKCSWRIASLIFNRFKAGGEAMTAEEIKRETDIPMRFVNSLLYDMTQMHILVEVVYDEKGEDARYMPAEAPENITEDVLRVRLGELGETIEPKGERGAGTP